MHRATPSNTSFRAYVAGGARSIVDKVDDTKLMQEMAGNIMKNESRKGIEAPQNYGFTSVVAEATKDAAGKIIMGAETFHSFLGGNRSLPIAGAMDDRRHRLKELMQGDAAMHGLREWGQQFHINKDGMFLTGNKDKSRLRMQLVENNQDQNPSQQQQAGPNGASGSAQQQPQAKGQKALYGKESTQYAEVNQDRNESMNKEHKIMLDDKDTVVHMKDKQVYLGGEKGKHTFSKVMTEDGPAKNVWARID